MSCRFGTWTGLRVPGPIFGERKVDNIAYIDSRVEAIVSVANLSLTDTLSAVY